MKTTFKTIAIVAFVLTFAAACKKDNSNCGGQSDQQVASEKILADAADLDFKDATVLGGTETEAFYADKDGLPEEYQPGWGNGDTKGGTGTGGTVDPKGNVPTDPGKALRACLEKLQLTEEQRSKVRATLKDFEGCKLAATTRYLKSYREMVARYAKIHAELMAMVKERKITKEQFEQKMKGLREMMASELKTLKTKEADLLKACYEKCLQSIQGTLTPQQWEIFVDCYKNGRKNTGDGTGTGGKKG